MTDARTRATEIILAWAEDSQASKSPQGLFLLAERFAEALREHPDAKRLDKLEAWGGDYCASENRGKPASFSVSARSHRLVECGQGHPHATLRAAIDAMEEN